ncbi:MAG: inosine/xanthosine triphosphatase [Anaerolineales bacterium]|jgi:inosine/xanthosine triphosphatase
MKNIVIASHNPVKIEATRLGFQSMFPEERFRIDAVLASSGVHDQPMSSQETIIGAKNRVQAAQNQRQEADFWVGIEGGVEAAGEELAAFAWVVIRSEKLEGKSRTGTFFLPPSVARLIRQGKELGDADDIIFNQSNSKQANGAIGILTDNIIDRTALYAHAVTLALVPFKNPILFSAQ